MLSVVNLDTFYDRAPVLSGLNFEVGRGQTLAILGPNGIGKSTLLHAVLGLAPSRGRISIDGLDVTGSPDSRVRRFGIALLPQAQRVARSLQVKDSLLLAATTLPKQIRTLLTAWMTGSAEYPLWDVYPIAALSPLAELIRPLLRRYGDQLSGGEEAVAGVACALLAGRRYLLLDEPTAGVNDTWLGPLSQSLKVGAGAGNLGIVLVEQNQRFASSISTHEVRLDCIKLGLVAEALSRPPI